MAIIQPALKKMIGIFMMTVNAEEVTMYTVKTLIYCFIVELDDYSLNIIYNYRISSKNQSAISLSIEECRFQLKQPKQLIQQ